MGFVFGAASFVPLHFLVGGALHAYDPHSGQIKVVLTAIAAAIVGLTIVAQLLLGVLNPRYPMFSDFARGFVVVWPCPFLIGLFHALLT